MNVLSQGTFKEMCASLCRQAAVVNALALAAAGVSISAPRRHDHKGGKKRGARGNGSQQRGGPACDQRWTSF
jgi:hypothetical protein